MGDPPGNNMGDSCCEAARNGDCGAGHKGRVGETWVSCWDSVCGKQDKRLTGLARTRNEDLRSAHNETGSTHNMSVARTTETVVCNYEANPRYCTFANSWSTPCREHSTCIYFCTVLLLRVVHET